MNRRKKLVLILVVTVVVIGGILGGTAVALAGDEEEAQTKSFLDTVAEIYEANTSTPIDVTQLEAAIEQARDERKTEARAAMFDKLVEEGILTQAEADEYQDWLDARPDIDIDLPGPDCPFGKMFREKTGRLHGFSFSLPRFERTEATNAK